MGDTYPIRPVGHVHVRDGAFRLEIAGDYLPALKGLEGFSHLRNRRRHPEAAGVVASNPLLYSHVVAGFTTIRMPGR
ncbi:MAG: hypothetical protein C4536_15730 [Actinobacteria bacterium]|jgi:hypothetical protein|nr:MAG: hypothetical protein C4536_15730 [Actinomycetota bacterium]